MTSSLTALWSEKILDMISIFLNLLRLDLWPKTWSILENVPCALEKKMYSSVAFGNCNSIAVESKIYIPFGTFPPAIPASESSFTPPP